MHRANIKFFQSQSPLRFFTFSNSEKPLIRIFSTKKGRIAAVLF